MVSVEGSPPQTKEEKAVLGKHRKTYPDWPIDQQVPKKVRSVAVNYQKISWVTITGGIMVVALTQELMTISINDCMI